MLETLKSKIIYDIEVFPNYFCFVAKRLNEDKWFRFQLNQFSDLNEITKLHKVLSSKAAWIAFNQIHYDNVVLNFMFKHWKEYKDSTAFLSDVKDFSDLIIDSNTPYEAIKEYKYNNDCYQPITIDLFLYWSMGLRKSKKISLKALAIGLKHKKLQELPYKPDKVLTLEEQEKVFKYCDNDVLVTEKLYNNLYDTSNLKTGSIKLRDDVFRKTGLNCYSWDTPKIASETLIKAFCESTGENPYEVRKYSFNKFTNLRVGDLFKDVDISFKTPTLQKVWDRIQNSINTVSEEFVFICNETRIKMSVGVGGIHSVNKNEAYFTDNDFDLYTSDVALI